MRRAVRLLATSFCLLALAACATRPQASDGVVELVPGQRKAISVDAALHYVRVASDSRCPPDVTCIHAGWAEIDVELERQGRPASTHRLGTREATRAARVHGWQLELVDLGRGDPPAARIRVTPITN